MNKLKKILIRIYRKFFHPKNLWEEITEKEILTLCSKESEYSLNTQPRDKKIIVSLTSFSPRLAKLHLVIRSIFTQTMKPDCIIMYFGDDVSDEQIPNTLKDLQKFGLKIEHRSGNLKPHKKYYYAIKEYPDDIIITIDDDIIYADNLIEELYNTYKQFPDCVVAARAHKIRFEKNGTICEYSWWNWEYGKVNRPSLMLLPTGVGGVLYPPHCMDSRLLDISLIQELSLNADDLWLKAMQVLAGTKVVLCNQKVLHNHKIVPGSQQVTLYSANVHQNMNDVYMKQLMDYFNLSKKDFTD